MNTSTHGTRIPGLQPVQFGTASHRLRGFLHRGRPPRDGSRRCPVLILNPFGQEAIRTHRLQRVVADRLARAGHDVLRFDWYGSGDSGGDDRDAMLSTWVDDALLAHDFLLAQPGTGRQPAQTSPTGSGRALPAVWFGIRLGATVALLAAQRLGPAPPAPDHLVLWEPVLDGKAYLASLVADHRRAVRVSYSLPGVARQLLAGFNDALPGELSGFAVAAAFVEQLRALHLPEAQAPGLRVTHLVNADGASASPGVIQLDVTFDWSSEEALNTALVPAPAVAAILRAIGVDSPPATGAPALPRTRP